MKKPQKPFFYYRISKEALISFVCITIASVAIIISFFVFIKSEDDAENEAQETQRSTVAPIIYSPQSPKSLDYTSFGDGSCSISGIGRYAGSELSIPEKSPSGDTVIGIEAKAFENCYQLTSLTIPATVTKIGEQAFKGCASLSEISVDMSNKSYCSSNGMLFSKDKSRLIFCPPQRVGSSYQLDTKVKVIADYAFFGVQNLNRVYYEGSTTDFESIKIGKGNEDFTSLPITCNYVSYK